MKTKKQSKVACIDECCHVLLLYQKNGCELLTQPSNIF